MLSNLRLAGDSLGPAGGLNSGWRQRRGDALDLASLIYALGASRRRGNVAVALAAVAGVTLLDIAAGAALTARHRRRGEPRELPRSQRLAMWERRPDQAIHGQMPPL